MRNSIERYGYRSIFMHWLTVTLIILTYFMIEARYTVDDDAVTDLMRDAHYTMGLLIMVLALIRVREALISVRPRIVPELSRLTGRTSRLTHWAMYAFLIIVPLTGWVYLSVRGKPVDFLWFELPAIWHKELGAIATVKYMHYYIGAAGYFLIGLHALAALYHHWWRRDNTLHRILPIVRDWTRNKRDSA